MIRLSAALLAVWPLTASAQVLSFPGNAVMGAEDDAGLTTYALPTGPWDGILPTTEYEGRVVRQAWRIEAPGLSTLQLLRPLREQLRNAGYTIAFNCQTEACGGFDFRFAMQVIAPPAMHVNLGDFRFMSAINGETAIGLLVSRTDDAGFVHVTQVGIADQVIVTADAPAARAEGIVTDTKDLAASLNDIGRFVLHDLAFETGSSQLGSGPFDTLQALADFLGAAPDTTVALVGHTDSSGSLDGNIALSKRRAGSVLERLVTDYGVDRQQLEAQGNGYLSPVANNATEAGRDANRRVEVIITSTQ